MISINIQQIINIIPSILQYFVPGYIFLTLYNWIMSKTSADNQKMIGSCVISFISISIIKALNSYLLKWNKLDTNIWIGAICSIFLCSIVSILFAKLFSCKKVDRFINEIFSVSLHKEILDSLIDKSANIKIYFKNKDYYFIGHLNSYSIEKGETMICVSQQIKYDFNDNEIYSQESTPNAYLLFNLKEVDYIEIFDV